MIRSGKPQQAEAKANPALSNKRGKRVIGYYSLAPASVAPEAAPGRVMKGQGRYPAQVILMARFALDLKAQGKRCGKTLFRDALRRALTGEEAISGRVFLVHAKDAEARAFYARFGLEASPTNPLHLFLLFKNIRKSLDAAEKRQP